MKRTKAIVSYLLFMIFLRDIYLELCVQHRYKSFIWFLRATVLTLPVLLIIPLFTNVDQHLMKL